MVGTIAHQMLAFALRANANRDAFILVGIQLEEVAATFAFDVGKVVDRILVLCAVASQFLAKIGVIAPIPIVTTFRECHSGSDAERFDSPSGGMHHCAPDRRLGAIVDSAEFCRISILAIVLDASRRLEETYVMWDVGVFASW